MSTSIYPTSNLNTYFTSNRALTIEDFRDTSLVTPSTTITLENTILTYSPNLGIIFCSVCKKTLNPKTYLTHLSIKHKQSYNRYKEDNILELLELRVNRLTLYSIEEITTIIEHNKYLFTELDVILKAFKCRDCDYISRARKEVRKHFNKFHSTNIARSTKRADYIIDNIPMQIISGLLKNTKIYFIPLLPKLDSTIEDNSSTTSSTSTSRSNSLSPNTRIEELENLIPESSTRILNSYKEDRLTLEQSINTTSILETNTKLLSSFITKSNILKFLKDKDRATLINIGYSNIDPTLNLVENRMPFDLELIETLTLEYLEEASSKINSIPLGLRQRLKSSNVIKKDREFRDFIPLDSKYTRGTYFKVYGQLIPYLLKVHYISSRFRNSRDEEELKYYRIAKEINLPRKLKRGLNLIVNFDFNTINIDENRLELYYNFSKVFVELLTIKEDLKISIDTTLSNIVIVFYYIRCLNRNTGEINDLLSIGKLTSILIYNSRLVTISYYYYIEIRNDNNIEEIVASPPIEEGEPTIEEDNPTSSVGSITIEEFIIKHLTNNSRNYFEFLLIIAPYLLALNKESITTTGLIGEIRPDLILYNNIEYPIPKIKVLFTNIYNKLEDLLLNKLFNISRIEDLGLDFNLVNDNNLNNKIGASLLDIEELKDLKYKPYFLEKLLRRNSYYNRTLFKGIKEDKIIFNPSKIERFNNNINTFIVYLALAIYLYSGGPLRGTKLTTILFKNIETKSRSLL